MKKLVILGFIILAGCGQKSTEIPSQDISSQKPTEEIILDSQNLVLGTAGDVAEIITMGPAKTGIVLTKNVTISNTTGAKITLNFTDIKNQLSLGTNTRWSIATTPANTCAAAIKNGDSCQFTMRLGYAENEDYTQNIITNVAPTGSTRAFNLTFKGTVNKAVVTPNPMSDFYSLDAYSVSFNLSPTILTGTKRFYLTNISNVLRKVPTIVMPPHSTLATGGSCVVGADLAATNGSCFFNVNVAYSDLPADSAVSEYVAFSLADTSINTSAFRINVNIVNQPPPTKKVELIQSLNSILVLSDATKTVRLYVKNTGTISFPTTVQTNNADLSPFFSPTTNCPATLTAGGSCYYDYKIDTSKTANMVNVTKVIKIADTDGSLYAGANPSTTVSNAIVCSTGYSVVNNACVSIAGPVARKVTVNKKLNATLSSLPTASAASLITIRSMNVAQNSFSTPAISMASSSSSAVFNTTEADLVDKSVINVQYINASTTSAGYKYLGSKLDNGSLQSYDTTSPAIGLAIPVSSTIDHTIDLMYEVDCSQASTVVAIQETGLVSTNVLTYKKNVVQTKCIVDTCSATFTKAPNELSCIAPPTACLVADAVANGVNILNSNSTVQGMVTAGDKSFCLLADTSCNVNYTLAGNKKSCIADEVACTLPDAIANGVNVQYSNSAIQGKIVGGDKAACLLADTACNPTSTLAADKKSCSAPIPVVCTTANSVGFGLTTISNVLTVKGNQPTCLVATCEVGYSVSADEKTCAKDPVVCTTANSIGFGLTTVSNVLTVKGNQPACLVATCATGYSVSADEKTCTQDPIACTPANSVGFGLTTISNVLTVKGNQPECKVATCAVGYSVSADEKTCTQDPIACTPANSVGFGLTTISNVLTVKGNQPECKVATCAVGYSVSADEKACTQDPIACTPANSVGFGLTSVANVATVKGNQPECLVATCSTGYAVSADEKSCTADLVINPITVIRGSDAKDKKCSVSITGLPMVNDTSMGIDLGDASTVNQMDSTGNATVSVVSCSPGYSAILKEVASAISIETAIPSSITNCALGSSCIVPMNQARFIKMDVSTVEYNFSAIAQDSSGVAITATIGSISPTAFSMHIGSTAVPVSVSLSTSPLYTTTECNAYSASAGNNVVAPNCANITAASLYEVSAWTVPAGTTGSAISGLTNSISLTGFPASTLATDNKIIAVVSPKTQSIIADSDLTSYISSSFYTSFPQYEDYMELDHKFYERNLKNKISSVKLRVLKKNTQGTYVDFSENLDLACNGSTDLNFSTNPNIASCILVASNYSELTFRYDMDASLVAAEAVPGADIEELEDEFRTGEYRLEYTVQSVKISDGSAMGSRVVNYDVKLNANNDFTPSLSLSKVSNDSYVPNHAWDRIPVIYNAWGTAGGDYEIGQSTKFYNNATGTTDTVAQYRNMDYSFSVPYIEDATPVKIKVDLSQVSDSSKAYNVVVGIRDARSSSCRYMNNKLVGNDNISFANIANRKTVSQMSASELTASQTNFTFYAESADAFNNADSTKRGCQATGSGIVSLPAANPIFTEKYDFIGNDNWTCEAGEVCYVNNLADSSASTLKIAQRTYRVRGQVRSQDNEMNISAQVLRVEKAGSGVSLGVAGVNFAAVPRVDTTMVDGVAYVGPTNDSNLTWIDYKAPNNSNIKMGIESLTGISCSTGCEYSFVKYGTGVTETNANLKNPGLYMANSSKDAGMTYQVGSTQIMDLKPYSSSSNNVVNNSIEVLAIIKKDNATYRRLIHFASTTYTHEAAYLYAIKSEYSGSSLQSMRLIYDFTRASGLVAASFVNVDGANYAHKVRQGMYPETPVGIAAATNYPAGTSFAVSGSDYLPANEATAALDFQKLTRVDYYHSEFANPTVYANQIDYVYTYLRFKQCPSTAPYFYYSEGAGYSCKTTVQAQADQWAL